MSMTKEPTRERNLEDWKRLEQIIDESGLSVNAFAAVSDCRGARTSTRSGAATTASAATWPCVSTPVFRNTASAG